MNICADKLCLSLGGFSLKEASLTINEGEIFALIGETGSGKTVFLEALAGFYEPDSGAVLYNGKNVREILLENRRIGFVYQDYALFPHMTVRKNIEFGLRMHKLPPEERTERADHMMELLKISHLADRRPGSLSGGEQQRSALARALVLKPEVLFMDEPFSALDPNTKQKMYALMRDIHKEFGCTIIFVTHDFREARELADRVGVMIKGQLRLVCGADELGISHGDEEVDLFLGN